MGNIFEANESDPRFVNCRAVKYMSLHNQRVSDAVTARNIRFEEQRNAYAVQIIQHDAPVNKSVPCDWFRTVADKLRHAGGGFRLLSFRLRLGRLLIEFQSAGRSPK